MFVHRINPIFLSLGPLQIRYYGLIYAAGLLLCYWWFRKRALAERLFTEEQADRFFLWLAVAVVLGARLFEILFYQPAWYFSHPAEIIMVWHGGLSFHGGLIGAAAVAFFFSRRHKISLLRLADIIIVPASLALGFGRLANFINGELYGKVTSVPWGVIFPVAGEAVRHPTQLYEAAKNFFLFFFLHHQEKKQRKTGEVFSFFLIGYGALRFFIEFLKEPEAMIGPLAVGQAFSLLMVVVGVVLLVKARKR